MVLHALHFSHSVAQLDLAHLRGGHDQAADGMHEVAVYE